MSALHADARMGTGGLNSSHSLVGGNLILMTWPQRRVAEAPPEPDGRKHPLVAGSSNSRPWQGVVVEGFDRSSDRSLKIRRAEIDPEETSVAQILRP